MVALPRAGIWSVVPSAHHTAHHQKVSESALATSHPSGNIQPQPYTRLSSLSVSSGFQLPCRTALYLGTTGIAVSSHIFTKTRVIAISDRLQPRQEAFFESMRKSNAQGFSVRSL
jgi:hypothetical protein